MGFSVTSFTSSWKMHPEIEVLKQRWPLKEQELADGFKCVTEDDGIRKKILTESKMPELVMIRVSAV